MVLLADEVMIPEQGWNFRESYCMVLFLYHSKKYGKGARYNFYYRNKLSDFHPNVGHQK
jgi:hypothetical protein